MNAKFESGSHSPGDVTRVDIKNGDFLTANDGLLINVNTRALLDTLTTATSTEEGVRAIVDSLSTNGLLMPGKIFMLGTGGPILGRHLISSLTTTYPDSLPQKIDRISFFLPEGGNSLGMSAVYQDPYYSPATSRQEAEIPISGIITPDNPMRLIVATREYRLGEREWSEPSVKDTLVSDEQQVLEYMRRLSQAYLEVIE